MGEISEWFEKNKEGLIIGGVAALLGGDYVKKKLNDYISGAGDRISQRIADRVSESLQKLDAKYKPSEAAEHSA